VTPFLLYLIKIKNCMEEHFSNLRKIAIVISCHGLGYFWIILGISGPRICWDTFGNIMT
jgi:hypothetical protein